MNGDGAGHYLDGLPPEQAAELARVNEPGLTALDARIRVRPGTSSTGFMTWEDELGLDRWRTGDVFGETELPVLFAHGQHNRPDSIVLATTELVPPGLDPDPLATVERLVAAENAGQSADGGPH